MKQLSLSNKQKRNLLTMAKYFFSESAIEMYYDDDVYDNWQEASRDTPLSCGNDAQINYLIFNWHKRNAFIIHWFEFCVFHLTPKLGYSSAWLMETQTGYQIIKDYHPVDFLYEEFKKLTK